MTFLTIWKDLDFIAETEKMELYPFDIEDNRYAVWLPKKCIREGEKHFLTLWLTKDFTFNLQNRDTKEYRKITATDLIKMVCKENIEKTLAKLNGEK